VAVESPLMRRTLVGLFAAGCMAAALLTPVATRAETPEVTVLVHGSQGSAEAALGALEGIGLPVVHRMNAIGVVVTTGPASLITQLRSDRRIERVEMEPSPIEFHLATSRRAIRMDDASTITTPGPQGFAVPYDGSGVTIAIVDQGIDATHPMFRLPDGTSSVVRNLELVCLDRYPVAGNRDVCGAAGIEDTTAFVEAEEPLNTSEGPLEGHGTHVASTAAGQRVTTSDGRTLQGIAPGARLIGLGATSDISVTWAGIAALNWVIENHRFPCGRDVPKSKCPPIRVVNNSWGYPDPYDEKSALAKATRALLDAGVAISWSAGNRGEVTDGKARTNSAGHTAQQGIVSVASYNDSDRGGRDGYLSNFSSRGLRGQTITYPDISAPGDGITAACRPYLAICSTGGDARDPNYNTISGTSMASPHVAGAMALLFQANPKLQPADIERILEETAYEFRSRGQYEPDPLNPSSKTSYDKGHGLLDVAGALAKATGRANPPVRTYPDSYRPPAPAGAAAIGQDHDWKGGPLAGANVSGCGEGSKVGECDLHGVRLSIPEGGADITVVINPTGSPVGVELIGPDGSLAAGNYFVDTVGKKTLEATGFTPGVWTVAVWAEWGAIPTYTGSISLSEPIED
jgi:serine protease AprX